MQWKKIVLWKMWIHSIWINNARQCDEPNAQWAEYDGILTRPLSTEINYGAVASCISECVCFQWFQQSPSLPSCQTVTLGLAPLLRWLQTDWPVKPKKLANAVDTWNCSGMKTSPCKGPPHIHTTTHSLTSIQSCVLIPDKIGRHAPTLLLSLCGWM